MAANTKFFVRYKQQTADTIGMDPDDKLRLVRCVAQYVDLEELSFRDPYTIAAKWHIIEEGARSVGVEYKAFRVALLIAVNAEVATMSLKGRIRNEVAAASR